MEANKTKSKDMSNRSHAALIGDLVESRRHPDRAKLQHELARKLNELNRLLGPETLAAPLALTAGDEIQALFRMPSAIPGAIQEITDAPLEQGLAFGVGWGSLSTGAPPDSPKQAENVALLDGPCFHLAREGLQRARKHKAWAAFGGFGAEADAVLGSLFDLMGAIRERWTPTQSLYIVDARRTGRQRTVAEKHGISPSVVSQSLKAAHFETVRRGEETARIVLARFDNQPMEGA